MSTWHQVVTRDENGAELIEVCYRDRKAAEQALDLLKLTGKPGFIKEVERS